MIEPELPPLSLYIHIPWCQRKCPYCDFNSHQQRDALPETAYIDALLQDLEQDLPLAQGRPLHSIFIGGGTPSLFSGRAIRTLLDGIRSRIAVPADTEITLEANPGSAEIQRFADYLEAGVNRLSLGIQSFDALLLQGLGRVHDSEQARAAVAMAEKLPLRSFNIDLMHGLPGQSLASSQADLASASASTAAHISWYQLTIEPNTAFYKRPPPLPVEDLLGDIQRRGEQWLSAAGYQAYEVSAWARAPAANAAARCAHNLNYWRFGDYLGIGAGAHGKVTRLSPQPVCRRLAKRRQPDDYLRAGPGRHICEHRQLQQKDMVAEFMLNALRLHEGFHQDLFTRRTGLGLEALAPQLEQLQTRGLLAVNDGQIAASRQGRRFLDAVIAEFF